MNQARRHSPADPPADPEIATATSLPADSVERRIAAALRADSRFEAELTAIDLTHILRRLVYVVFDLRTFAGIDLDLAHQVVAVGVAIHDSQADIEFTVHIQRPIVATLHFAYSLLNDTAAFGRRLRIKPGTLRVEERTRRFDLKAKAALAAVNVESLARHEISDLSQIIYKTLPAKLEEHGVAGALTNVELALQEQGLHVCLEGHFWPIAVDGRSHLAS